MVGDEGRFITSEKKDGLNHVSDLIDFHVVEWNAPLIEESFDENDVRIILAIPLSSMLGCDELTWALTKSWEYSVKTAYMLGKGGNLDLFHQAWVDVWSSETIPKVKHFLWRMCTTSLPVRALLKYRHFIEDAACPWGCGEDETISHALFIYPRVKEVWQACGCADMCVIDQNSSLCDVTVTWQHIDPKVKQRGFYLAWVLWAARNTLVFRNQITPQRVLVDRVARLVEEQGQYMKQIYHVPRSTPSPTSKTWIAPPEGIIKLNADASLATEGWVGLGVVARDSSGHVLFAGTRRVKAYWSPEIAEAKALVFGAQLAKSL